MCVKVCFLPLFLSSLICSCCSWSTGPRCALFCRVSWRRGSCLLSTVSPKVSPRLARSPFIRPGKSNTLLIFTLLQLHLSASSQEELQQRNHPGNSWTKRRGRRRADSHQGLSQVSNHFPTHPASSPGPRLQAHTGKQTKGLIALFCLCAPKSFWNEENFILNLSPVQFSHCLVRIRFMMYAVYCKLIKVFKHVKPVFWAPIYCCILAP